MTKEKSDKTDGGGAPFARYVPLMIILGIVLAVGGIFLFCPALWESYYIPILLIAAGLAIPFLFSPWKFWAGYGVQVGIAPGLAFVLMGVFILLFGYTTDGLWQDAVSNLIWTNTVVLLLWFIFIVFFLFRRRKNSGQKMQGYYRGERWRDYRWVIAPAVLILLFLFDTSWAQSTLSTSSLKKTVIDSTSPASVQFHAEYPSQILFDDPEPSEIHLWATGSLNCTKLVITGEGLLFAIKPSSDSSIEWYPSLSIRFDKKTKAKTLLVQPVKPPESDSQRIQIELNSSDKTLAWWINIESKRDSQIRDWKKNFLGTGSMVVSLITAVFVGIKQLEEEKKRQRAEGIKQAIATFDTDAKNDLSKILQEHLELTADWDEWDRALQEQLRKAYTSCIEKELWEALAAKTIAEVKEGVALLSQICDRIFKIEQEKPVATLKQLQSALQQDEHASFNLLSMLKEYPASINAAKIIAGAFSPALKTKTITNYTSKFPKQIRDLRVELNFPDLESFPLQEQFTFYKKKHISESRLTDWLKAHELKCSPFEDADSPFYTVLNDQLLIDFASPGFVFSMPDLKNRAFEFSNSWDASVALLSYCQSYRGDFTRIDEKEKTLFVVITPNLIKDYISTHTQKLYLHALAEQWIWSLAEAPTLFYILKDSQRDLVGRLLRWHDFSPSIAVNKIAEFSRYLQESRKGKEKEEQEERGKEEEKNQKVFFSKIVEWLTNTNADDLRTEETNAMIGLRPLPKKRTVFLISSVDLNPHVTTQIPSSLHETMNEQSDWLSAHDCGLIRFLISDKNWQTVSVSELVNQCNIRVRKCSKTGNVEFNQFFDAPGLEPDAILAQKANGSPGRMVRLGQKLLMQHVERYPSSELLHIEDLIALR